MPFASRIEARAYSYATESIDRVRAAVTNVYAEEIRQDLKIEMNKTQSHNQVPIVIVSAVLNRKKDCKLTFDHLMKAFPQDDRLEIGRTLHKRISERCVLFLRLDKQEAFLERITLARGPDVVGVKVYLRQYPRCVLDDAIALVRSQLQVSGGRF
jgi:RNA binding exosome subunit